MITDKELDALPENKRAQLTELMAVLPVDDYPVRAAKTLLVNGFKPEFVAEYTGVKLEKVIDLYENSWNPRCRKPNKKPMKEVPLQRKKEMLMMFNRGDTLQAIAKSFAVSVFCVWITLVKLGVEQCRLNCRLPEEGTRARQNFEYMYRHASRSHLMPLQNLTWEKTK
ncbi:hypothetical protein MTQ71_24790 [Escherichia coli]|nr:hypothetical protein [Escherichia coli]